MGTICSTIANAFHVVLCWNLSLTIIQPQHKHWLESDHMAYNYPYGEVELEGQLDILIRWWALDDILQVCFTL